MSTRSLVSVVIICYNGEQFLAEAIDSVIAQTYNNWELFLVDDGSSDRSVTIMQEYVTRYPDKIRYLQHPKHQNRGQNASRNLGITHAKGKYIALLDCDDVWLPHKLTRQVALMEQNPEAMMIEGQAYFWYGWTGKPEDIVQDRLDPLPVKPNQLNNPPHLLTILLEGKSFYSNPSTPLWHHKVFTKVGLYDEDFRDIYEDFDFLAKVFYSVPVYAVDEYWTKYRQHSDSTVAKLKPSLVKDKIFWNQKRLNLFKSIQKYVVVQEIKYPEIINYLDRRIFWLEKKLWLFASTVWLSRIYNYFYYLWLQLIERSLSLGRVLLPFTLRDWLWRKIGKHLYYLFD